MLESKAASKCFHFELAYEASAAVKSALLHLELVLKA